MGTVLKESSLAGVPPVIGGLGTSYMFIKIAAQTVQPVTSVARGPLIACLGLFAVPASGALGLPREWRIWRHHAFIGVVNVAIPFILIVRRVRRQWPDSGVTSIVNSTVPLFSIVIAGFLWRMERVTAGCTCWGCWSASVALVFAAQPGPG